MHQFREKNAKYIRFQIRTSLLLHDDKVIIIVFIGQLETFVKD